ncbi:MAG: cell division protein FtsZ [Draconibacterium sp.]|nr:cell division protein FtsZ [Draconibacterium sp.]
MTEELVNFQFPKTSSSIIKVVGVGGGGCNAVSHMYEEGIKGVDYLICNTDSQALESSPVSVKIQLGVTLTEGRGAGNKPEMGEQSARENYEDIKAVLEDNTKMLFITAGMGGGTGTGAAPVIASLARELGILTIAVVTIPSPAEGEKRNKQAREGIKKLGKFVDSMLVISNQQLYKIYGDLPARQAFKMADNIVATAVKGVAEIITVHGNVNIDFTDVHTVLNNSELFIMGTGFSSGEGRAMNAVNKALESPLLDSNDIYGTKNILLNIISGKEEIRIGEIGEIIETLQEKAGQEADIIWGNGYDESLGDNVSVTILATGFENNPNQTFQDKKEPEIFELDKDQEEFEQEQNIIEEVETQSSFLIEPEENENEFEMSEAETNIFTVRKKSRKENLTVSKREKRIKKRKPKVDEPVTESNVDNWFFKNFGLAKLFDDGEDQAAE